MDAGATADGAPAEGLTAAAGPGDGNGGEARIEGFEPHTAKMWSARIFSEGNISGGGGAAAVACCCHSLAATASASADGASDGVGARVDIEGGG